MQTFQLNCSKLLAWMPARTTFFGREVLTRIWVWRSQASKLCYSTRILFFFSS